MGMSHRLRVWHRSLMGNVLLRRRLMIILALLPVILLIIMCNNIYVDIYEYKTDYQNTITQLEEAKNKHIDDIINNRKAEMRLQNAYTIEYIRHQLNHEYNKNDIHSIEKELLSNDSHTSLFSIYYNAMTMDSTNTKAFGSDKQERLYLADKDRIIISPKNVTKDLFVPWSDEINRSSNKELEKSVITSIITEDRTGDSTDDDILFVSDNNVPYNFNGNLKDPNGKLLVIDKPGMENINKIIDSGGLNALKGYRLVVPSYFDAGYMLTKNNQGNTISHKLILIRSSNLYKIVKPYNYYISNYNDLIQDYKTRTETAIVGKIIICILISAFLIFLFSICLHIISNSCRFESISDSRKGGNIDG